MNHDTISISRTTHNVKTNRTLPIELIFLADACLDDYNRLWARFVVTGDDDAYRLAMVAKEDRERLLAEVGSCHVTH